MTRTRFADLTIARPGDFRVRGIAFAFPLRNTCFDQAAQGKTVMKGLQNRVLGIFLGIFFSIVIAPALAHDPSHPELNGWFNKLASGKGLCCSFADGYVVADADWETRDGHYKVRIPKVVGSADMEWVDVPDDALITEPNRAGRTMVWPMRFNGEISIRCFMPGSMT